MVQRRHIIIKRPGLAPVTKSPINTHGGMIDMLKEIESLYPDATVLAVEVTWSGNIWVHEAKEVLMCHAAATGELPDFEDD